MIYHTKGVCSRSMEVEVDEQGIITKAVINGGCPGNTTGLAKLAVGRKAEDIIALCDGIRCGGRPTSCPDQLAQALKQALAK